MVIIKRRGRSRFLKTPNLKPTALSAFRNPFKSFTDIPLKSAIIATLAPFSSSEAFFTISIFWILVFAMLPMLNYEFMRMMLKEILIFFALFAFVSFRPRRESSIGSGHFSCRPKTKNGFAPQTKNHYWFPRQDLRFFQATYCLRI